MNVPNTQHREPQQILTQILWSLNLKHTDGDGLGPDSTVTNMTFLQELEAVCLTASQGELLLVQSNKDVEEVLPYTAFYDGT